MLFRSKRWSIQPTARIVANVKRAHPDIPIVGFPNRCGASILPYAGETGVDAVQIDSMVPLAWARAETPSHVALQGNLDPQLLVAGGTAMRAEAERIIQTLTKGHISPPGAANAWPRRGPSGPEPSARSRTRSAARMSPPCTPRSAGCSSGWPHE